MLSRREHLSGQCLASLKGRNATGDMVSADRDRRQRAILQYSTLRYLEFEDDGNEDEANAVSAASKAGTDRPRSGPDPGNKPDPAGHL
jgi:hypothetical protein